MKLDIYLKRRKINMKKILLFGGILAATLGNLFSQANPGYLGRKNAVEFTGSYNFGTLFGLVVPSANAYNSSYGIGIEHTFSKNFSLAGGMRFGNVNIDANTMKSNLIYDLTSVESHLEVQTADNTGSQVVYNIDGGTTKVSMNEIYITPRFYVKNKGNIAPLGAFVGTELALGMVSISPTSMDMKSRSGAIKPMQVNGLSSNVISFTLQCGIKRMITDEIGVQVQYGMGAILSQSLTESAYFNDFPINTYGSIDALVRDGVMNDIAFNKLMQLHASVVYLF